MQCNDCGKCGNLKELFFHEGCYVAGRMHNQCKGWYEFSENFYIKCPKLVNEQNLNPNNKNIDLFQLIFYILPFDFKGFYTLQECFGYLLKDDRINLEETLHIIKLQSKLRGA